MLSFFKQLFSASLRRAREAEARGRIEEAIENYAVAGERAEVSRLHLLQARGLLEPTRRVERLRLAQRYAPEGTALERQSCAALGEALVSLVDSRVMIDRRDRAQLEEAAELFQIAGAFERSGDLFTRVGQTRRAASAYERAGCVDKLDALLEALEREREEAQAQRGRLDAFELAMLSGRFVEALEQIDSALAASPGDARLRARCEQLRRRMPASARVRLTVDGQAGSVTLLGEASVTIGRDESAALSLLAPGLSRLHARLLREGEALLVEDLGSKNGTFVDGQACAPVQRLGERGELRLGERCTLDYERLADGGLGLRPTLAMGRDHLYVWGTRWRSGTPPSDLPEGLRFTVEAGRWHLLAERTMRFGDERYHGATTLLLESVLHLPDGVVARVDQ